MQLQLRQQKQVSCSCVGSIAADADLFFLNPEGWRNRSYKDDLVFVADSQSTSKPYVYV